MKAKYKYEESLLEEYDFEPTIECYNIDDLKENDREQLAGMLWAFYLSRNYFNDTEETTLFGETLEKIHEEWLEIIREQYEINFISDIREFVVSCIDSYESEEE